MTSSRKRYRSERSDERWALVEPILTSSRESCGWARHAEAHDLITSVFGGMSKGERNRIKVQVRAATAAQAQIEGRFHGGRPPYGYQLVDLGPHPNPAKAADGASCTNWT